MISVPKLISYLHEFFLEFFPIPSELLRAIFIRVIFLIRKTTNAWGPAISGSVVPRRALIGYRGRHCPDTRAGD
jgi:hypothetical protein